MNSFKAGILLSYIGVASFSAAIITPALPMMQKNLHVDNGAIGWMVSIFLTGYMLGQFFYSPMANRFGRLSALRFGLSLNIIGTMICLAAAYADNYKGLLIGRLITSLGASAGLSCTFMLINESLSHGRAKHILSFATVSFTVSIGMAVVTGGFLSHNLHWHDCFWILLGHGILMLLLTTLFDETLKEAKKAHPWHMLKAYSEALTHRKLFVFSACVGMVSVLSYCFAAAAPFISRRLFGLNAEQYSYWNILNMLAMFSGAFLAARLVKKYNSVAIIKTAMILIIAGFIVMLFLGLYGNLKPLTFFTITAMAYFVSSWIFPTAGHIASNAVECKANASGAMNFINMGSAVLLVSVMGYLHFMILWNFIAVVLIFAILCLLGITMLPHADR